MNETITQRTVQQKLAREVGRFPGSTQSYMHDALSQATQDWNGAACDEPFPVQFESLLRDQLCKQAQAVLAAVALSEDSERLSRSAAHANLATLSTPRR